MGAFLIVKNEVYKLGWNLGANPSEGPGLKFCQPACLSFSIFKGLF